MNAIVTSALRLAVVGVLISLAPGLAGAQSKNGKEGESISQIADTRNNRAVLAERLVKVQDMDKMFRDTMANLANEFPEDERADFLDYAENAFDLSELRAVTIEAVSRHFTTGELSRLIEFYGSAVGRSINRKMAAYTADVMPEITLLVMQSAQAYFEKRH
jgi:hypothetical protein